MSGGTPRRRLVVDIGGTNIRFAVSRAPGVLADIKRMRVPDYAGLAKAAALYRAGLSDRSAFTEAAVAAAGPVVEGEVQLTNASWRVRASDLTAELTPGAPVRLFNDLEAVAHALPWLAQDDVAVLRDAPSQHAPCIAVNVGTGFGAAVAAPSEGGWRVLAGEAGHMCFAATTEDEQSLVGIFNTIEDVLSGAGLGRLRRHFEIDGILSPSRAARFEPSAVFAEAASDSSAAQALAVFTAVLGRVSGDLALASGALGGVFLCGGVVDHWRGLADRKAFFEAFDAKGVMTDRMRQTPVFAIARREPALLGLSHAPLGRQFRELV